MSEDLQLDVPGGVISGRVRRPGGQDAGAPLIVAIHGGSFTSAYFDTEGYSLLESAAAAGCVAVALDRPGYRSSTLPLHVDSILHANADILDAAIAELWRREGGRATGVVLVGHSIGAAVTTLIAARHRGGWPLLGIAVSAIGLRAPLHGAVFSPEPPAGTHLEVPPESIFAMFGDADKYTEDAPGAAQSARASVVFQEIVEINRWEPRAREIYAGVNVPVHYRQGDHDAAWAQGAEELESVRQAFTQAPFVDARLVEGAGHAIDFHTSGAGFHDEQVAFAKSLTDHSETRAHLQTAD